MPHSHPNKTWPYLVVFFLTSLVPAIESRGQTVAPDEPARVRVVLFHPKDVALPANYQMGINRLADYTDSFLRSGLKSWNLKMPVDSIFQRNGSDVRIYRIQGQQNAEAYQKAQTHREAIDRAMQKHQLKKSDGLWWVLVYLGPSPSRFSDFRGGYSPKYGGWSIANYDPRLATLETDQLLGTGLAKDIALKGMIHELGHAFSLPHIGPRYDNRRGNTLMGCTIARYERIAKDQSGKVYLSQAAAAMLIAHPVLRGLALPSGPLPSVQVRQQRLVTGDGLYLEGKIKSNGQPVYAIVGDHHDQLPGSYWVKHYVGRVSSDGTFRIAITEPNRHQGQFKLWFVFADGQSTGNGKQRSANGAIQWDYRFDRQWHLNSIR